MSVLVLGASGFLGRHITGALRASGHDVITVGRSGSMDFVVNVLEGERLAPVIGELAPECVINLLGAGLSDLTADPQLIETVNGRFPGNLASVLTRESPDAHLIHAASSTEGPAPDGSHESEYSRTKAQGTAALLSTNLGIRTTILRIHNTFGRDQPAQRFVASTINSLVGGHTIDLRYPDRVRDFIHVDDVAKAFVAAVDSRASGVSTYEVGTGVGTSLASVVRMVASILNINGPLVFAESAEDLHPRTVASPDLLLRPATVDLQSGLEMTVRERLRRDEFL